MTATTVYAPCAHCGARMATNHDRNGRPRLYCGDVCRQRACRIRHKTIAGWRDAPTLEPPPADRPTAAPATDRQCRPRRTTAQTQSVATGPRPDADRSRGAGTQAHR